MTTVLESVLETYLHAYRHLLEVEYVDGSAIISFPMHLAASHRIEISVTDWGKGRCILSDSARTLGEIEAAGYSLTRQMRERLERLAGTSGVMITDRHLTLETTYDELGLSIQQFLEICKTIGDVYLVHKQREGADDEIRMEIQSILTAMGLVYRLDEKVSGRIERHPFDVVVPPNGRPGLAVSVLSGRNTHSVAQIWYFKCDDVRNGDWYKSAKGKIALVYDVRHEQWSDSSREILESKADIAIASDSLNDLRVRLG